METFLIILFPSCTQHCKKLNMAAPHLKTGKFLPLSLQKEEKQKYRKKNPERLVTKHNCAGFLLCRLRYPAMKNGLLSKMPHSDPQSHNSPHFVMWCNSNGKNLFKFHTNWEYRIKHGKKECLKHS